MNIRERLLKFIENKGISKYKFYQETGFSNGFLDKEGTIGADKCEKLSYQYPDLNLEWLITGRGEMLRDRNIQKTQIHALDVNDESIDIQDKYTNNLQITKIDKPTKYMERILEFQDITLYNLSGAANLKTLFTEKNQNILGTIRLPNISKCDGALYVTGDSMEPIIKSGDIVCYKEINDVSSIIYGNMYLVSIDIEGDEYLTIKYITRSDKGEGWICLKSHNEYHSPQDFKLKYINALALIKVSIRMNTM